MGCNTSWSIFMTSSGKGIALTGGKRFKGEIVDGFSGGSKIVKLEKIA